MSKVEEINWCCFRKKYGFFKRIQSGKSIYVEFTTDITQAKIYKSKRAAATAMRFKNMNHEDLIYYEIKIVTYYPDVDKVLCNECCD